MNRKIISLLTAFALVFSVALFAACDDGKPSGQDGGEIQVNVTELDHVYDGTAKNPKVELIPADAGDMYVTLSQNGTRVDSAIDAGEYTVTVSLRNTDTPVYDVVKTMTIRPKELDLSAVAFAAKQYDGTVAYEQTLSDVEGIVAGDDVSIKVKGSFADASIGTGKTLTVSSAELEGTDKANYTVAALNSAKADITKKQLTITGITVSAKEADGSTDATWSGTPVLEGVVAGEDVSVTISKIEFPAVATGSYDMLVTAELGGADKDHYELAQPCGIRGSISSAAGDFQFDPETGTITGYTGTSNQVVIPSELNGVAVKKIGSKAFADSAIVEDGGTETAIEQITLPEGLTEIGAEAFTGSAISEIHFPSTVTSLGEYAFYYCDKLTTVTFADGITEMSWGDHLFRNTAVTGIEIPAAVTTIPDLCFQDTTGTGSFYIPNTVTYIGDSAFLRSAYSEFIFEEGGEDLICDKQVFAGAAMKSFEIPARMVQTGGSFFQNAASLETLTFDENRAKPLVMNKIEGAAAGFHLNGTAVKSLYIPGSVGTVPDGIANNALLTSVTLGEGITEIDDYAFYGTLITEIVIPKTVTRIGGMAFQACAQLQTVTFEKGGTEDLTIGEWSFQACAIAGTLEIPARTVTLGAACFAGNKITDLVFETGGTKPLVFADGADPTSAGKGYQFDGLLDTEVTLPARAQDYSNLTSVFPSGCTVTKESA